MTRVQVTKTQFRVQELFFNKWVFLFCFVLFVLWIVNIVGPVGQSLARLSRVYILGHLFEVLRKVRVGGNY